MADLFKPGAAIEGAAVRGQSRLPLVPRPPNSSNGVRCNVWVSKRDIKARVMREVDPAARRLLPSASISLDDEILCEKALVLSVADSFAASVEHGSHTHKTNVWRFNRQTAVEVEGPHEGLMNAAAKGRK